MPQHLRPQGNTHSISNQPVPQAGQQIPPPSGNQPLPISGRMGPPGPPNLQVPPQANQPPQVNNAVNGLPSNNQGQPPASMQKPPSHQQQMPGMMQMQKQNRLTPIAKPQGIDPIEILQERENRVTARVAHRIQELGKMPANFPDDLRVKATIEFKALRLLNFQRQVKYVL